MFCSYLFLVRLLIRVLADCGLWVVVLQLWIVQVGCFVSGRCRAVGFDFLGFGWWFVWDCLARYRFVVLD